MKSKLVRDGYLTIIPREELRLEENSGNIIALIEQKLLEEWQENKEKSYRDPEEWADVFEVMYALAAKHGVTKEKIENARVRKLEEKGGFDKAVVWQPRLPVAQELEDREQAVMVWADGACSGNPGPGGWGAVFQAGGWTHRLSGGATQTTNNQMELAAAIAVLEEIAKLDLRKVRIILDSRYVLDGIGQWLKGWKAKGWRTAGGKEVANQAQWKKIDLLIAQCSAQLEWQWTKGHNGDPGNEEADQLATNQVQHYKKM